MPKVFAYLLLPISCAYGGLMWLRNKAFDLGLLRSTSFPIPVVAVGNIRVGGTGKTPVVDHLTQLLSMHYELAILSRGYGRKSKGFLWVETDADATDVGDEPLLLKQKHPSVKVAVCEDRVAGIRKIRQEHPSIGLILLDDAMQHRWVRPSLLIGLSSCGDPFYRDLPMPSGMLREFRSGMARADLLLMTRYQPEMEGQNILQRTGHPNAHLSSLEYQNEPEGAVVGFSGLANNNIFEAYLRSTTELKTFVSFSDHHRYTQKDLDRLLKEAGDLPLVCTEKDAVKLAGLQGSERLHPVAIRMKVPSAFDQFILNKLSDLES